VALAQEAITQSLSLLEMWAKRQPLRLTALQADYLQKELERARAALAEAAQTFGQETEGKVYDQ
jgi:hypothetical protein